MVSEKAERSTTQHAVIDDAHLEMCRQEWLACMVLTGSPPSMFEFATHGCWEDVEHELCTALASAHEARADESAQTAWLLDREKALFDALQKVFVWRQRESAEKGKVYDRLSARVAHMAIFGVSLQP